MHMNASDRIKNQLFAGLIQRELSDRPTTSEIVKIRDSKYNLKRNLILIQQVWHKATLCTSELNKNELSSKHRLISI
jgi:hypothetical protein